MCTVTFIPGRSGYRLGMNRDERRNRARALPPRRHATAIYPSEPTGGTWISLNDTGVCVALINWYSVAVDVTRRSPVSRGEIVRRLAPIRDARELKIHTRDLLLDRVKPFRLINVFPASQEILELQWDLASLRALAHDWKPQQWISSGFDEPAAQRIRSQTFRAKIGEPDVGTARWLRRLHSSHSPEHGPFSTCMHRPDAVTVSYTEVAVTEARRTLRYYPGSPCDI